MNYTNRKFTQSVFDRIPKSMRNFVEEDEDERVQWSFSLSFTNGGSGFGFPCDSSGVVFESELSDLAKANLEKAYSMEWEKVEVHAYAHRIRFCDCGSRHERVAKHDARGIFLCYICQECREKKLKRYRRDVLTDSDYWSDEPIEDEA